MQRQFLEGELGDEFIEAWELQLDLMNPFNIVEVFVDPSMKNLLHAAYMPFIGLSGTYLAGVLGGTADVSLLHRWQMASIHNRQQFAKSITRSIPAVARAATSLPALAGAAVVGTAAAMTYDYERYVNEPIRKSHPGSKGTWFGPFGSGFGSVV